MPGRGQDKWLSVGELLLALAIIGALSTLLLPVFARARANARMALCLANIRTIAQAVRMYVSDNDGSLPPMERGPEVSALFSPGQPGHRPGRIPATSTDL